MGFSGKGEEDRKVDAPPPLVQFGLPMEGGATTPCGLAALSPMAHVGPLVSRGVPVTSRYSKNYSVLPKTIPVTECNLPIYQSLPLDHFETPRHVSDLIRDSKKTSVTKTHKS